MANTPVKDRDDIDPKPFVLEMKERGFTSFATEPKVQALLNEIDEKWATFDVFSDFDSFMPCGEDAYVLTWYRRGAPALDIVFRANEGSFAFEIHFEQRLPHHLIDEKLTLYKNERAPTSSEIDIADTLPKFMRAQGDYYNMFREVHILIERICEEMHVDPHETFPYAVLTQYKNSAPFLGDDPLSPQHRHASDDVTFLFQNTDQAALWSVGRQGQLEIVTQHQYEAVAIYNDRPQGVNTIHCPIAPPNAPRRSVGVSLNRQDAFEVGEYAVANGWKPTGTEKRLLLTPANARAIADHSTAR